MNDVKQQATLLFALASVLSGMNVILLMPAAQHPQAGLFTQALPFTVLALMLGLVLAGARTLRSDRRQEQEQEQGQ